MRQILKQYTSADFVIEEIEKHANNTSRNKSLHVGVPYDLLESLMKPDVWTENLIIRRFITKLAWREIYLQY